MKWITCARSAGRPTVCGGLRVGHVDFSIRVGVRVPHTVHVYPLPIEIVEIVPQYRGYDYIVVGDEMLIIDPITLEIVAVLPV